MGACWRAVNRVAGVALDTICSDIMKRRDGGHADYV